MDPKHDHEHSLTVIVHNEDEGGEPTEFHAGPGTPVQVIVDRWYSKVGERRPGDRFICLATGGDVFSHTAEHLGAYAATSCADLEWGWSRETGGA